MLIIINKTFHYKKDSTLFVFTFLCQIQMRMAFSHGALMIRGSSIVILFQNLKATFIRLTGSVCSY